MTKKLTLITHFYNAPHLLSRIVGLWKSYPAQLLEQIEFILVDDCSDEPWSVSFDGLPVRVFRIDSDIDWNQAGSRNLGAVHAVTDWFLLFDIDHFMSAHDLFVVLNTLETLDRNTIYLFGREYKGEQINLAVNCYLASRKGFFQTGGYDEDFAGHYGYEDVYFHMMWEKHVGGRACFQELKFYAEETATKSLNRDTSRNKALMNEKIAGERLSSGGILRFHWKELDTAADPLVMMPEGAGDAPGAGCDAAAAAGS